MRSLAVGALASCILTFASLASAQIVIIDPGPVRPPRPSPTDTDTCEVRNIKIDATIRDQLATVQLAQVFQSKSSRTLEAQFIFPVPDDAAIGQLTLLVDGKELPGKLMKKEDARRIYEDIVRRQKDPALLEYLGQGLYQTSVFPVPPGESRTVEIRYTQLLRNDQGLVDLLLPLGTARHAGNAIETVEINVRVEAADDIKTIYSPTHDVKLERPSDTRALATVTLRDVSRPDDFRLLFSTAKGAVGMSVVSYRPKADEPGYFLLLASPEVKRDRKAQVEKTVVFVLDRSGSMAGEKMEQARGALEYFLNQLRPSDTFNIVAYDSAVESFRPELQRADKKTVDEARAFSSSLYAGGSTNIDGALQSALGQLADKERPSYVLFLTDGLPTVGEQNEAKIAERAKSADKVGVRLFSFGVGYDVNSRLLDRLSRTLRGQSRYVRPNEDIEAHVSALYSKIGSPMLTDLKIDFDSDKPGAVPISRTYPRTLPDLYQGDQLLWIGRYQTDGPVKVTLSGTLGGERRTFDFSATLAKASHDETNGFVERLWATRRVGEIIDELDLSGQNEELIDELVALSLKHGILTPYTSFLADENTRLTLSESGARARGAVARQLSQESGADAFYQRRFKSQLQQADRFESQTAPAADSSYGAGYAGAAYGGYGGGRLSGSSTRGPAPARPVPAGAVNPFAPALPVEAATPATAPVRHVGQKTFFRKGDRWHDSAVTDEQAKKPVRVEQFSPEYFALAAADGGRFAKYVAFDEPLLVELAGTVYQIDPPASK